MHMNAISKSENYHLRIRRSIESPVLENIALRVLLEYLLVSGIIQNRLL